MDNLFASEPSRKLIRQFLRRFLVGFFLGVSIYLVEAGIAELLLAEDTRCIEAAQRMRFGPAPRLICYSEFTVILLNAFSFGVGSFLGPNLSAVSGLILAGGLYGLIGGLAAQMRRRSGMVTFLIVNLALVFSIGSFRYLSEFIR